MLKKLPMYFGFGKGMHVSHPMVWYTMIIFLLLSFSCVENPEQLGGSLRGLRLPGGLTLPALPGDQLDANQVGGSLAG